MIEQAYTVNTSVLAKELVWHLQAVPIQDGEVLRLLIKIDADEEWTRNELELQAGHSWPLVIAPVERVEELLAEHFPKSYNSTAAQGFLQDGEHVLETLISEARSLRSSDIHIERYEQRCRVRIRIDGVLVDRFQVYADTYPALVNRIKIQANLDIAEKRLPQDGRITFKTLREQFDIRVSVVPTLYGEKVVLRLLNRDAAAVELSDLGMRAEEHARFLEGVRRPSGLILLSGPTGSGKTTTLYATLKLLNTPERNIMTVEDPIEYTLEGINQVQLKEQIGLTFAQALRSFLRQDPDVIMLGEIRDSETAEMAVRASLTGHLVLSTVHTSSAWGTVGRLIDMGVPPFLLASTLRTTAAQRLVRKLCNSCKKSVHPSKMNWPPGFDLGSLPDSICSPVGCDKCYGTGYLGRIAIYEIIDVDHELSELIRTRASLIPTFFKERGIQTLQQNALELLARGETSVDEVYAYLN